MLILSRGFNSRPHRICKMSMLSTDSFSYAHYWISVSPKGRVCSFSKRLHGKTFSCGKKAINTFGSTLSSLCKPDVTVDRNSSVNEIQGFKVHCAQHPEYTKRCCSYVNVAFFCVQATASCSLHLKELVQENWDRSGGIL